MDIIIVEYRTTKLSSYCGFFSKSERKVSPYILVSCNAAPRNIEKRKNTAILYSLNNANALSPSFSESVAFFGIVFCGGHFGKVNAYNPSNTAKIAAI